MLPKKNGFEVCRELRQAGVDTAILMLTAKTLVGDRVTRLRLGADDYLVKPFDPSELLARVEALLRRVEKRSRVPVKSFAFDDVQIDFERAEVSRAGHKVALAAKELQLLEYLVLHRDRVLPREEILQQFGNTTAKSPRAPRMCMSRGCARSSIIRKAQGAYRPSAAKDTSSLRNGQSEA